jgi:hypothetical protein
MLKVPVPLRLLTCALLLAGPAIDGRALAASPDAPDFAWIDTRVAELQPTSGEKKFDEIGWARDIRHALAVAREQNRPVFLFTHDGRMNLGRC